VLTLFRLKNAVLSSVYPLTRDFGNAEAENRTPSTICSCFTFHKLVRLKWKNPEFPNCACVHTGSNVTSYSLVTERLWGFR
jgi:hypothetical protein